MKKNNGITLIALVITIIVLIILASVSIAMLTGENGLLNKVTDAEEITKLKNADEAMKLVVTEWQIEKNVGKMTLEEFLESKVLDDELDEYKKIEDGYELYKDGYVLVINEEGIIIVETQKAGVRPHGSVNMITTGYVLRGTNVQFKIDVTLPEELTGATVTITKPEGVTETEGVYSVAANGKYKFEIIANKDGVDYKTTAIANIDKILEKPTITVTDAASTYFTINLTTEYPTEANLKYVYCVGSTQTEKTTEKTYKKEGLAAGTSYSVKVRVYIDETNYMESDAVTAETKGTEIRTVQDLRNIASNMSGKYQLMNDIDLSGVSWSSINGTSSSATFSGTLDGNGYAIKNLSGDTTSTKRSIFYRLNYATIKNIEFENINLTVGSGWQGGIIAYHCDFSTIENVSVTGYLDTSADTGLVYNPQKSTFKNIYMNFTSNKGANSIYTSTNYTGTSASTLTNAIVLNSGIKSSGAMTIKNGFYYTTLTGTFGGTALTVDSMKNKNTFTEFDFEKVWYMDETAGHPKLRISQ